MNLFQKIIQYIIENTETVLTLLGVILSGVVIIILSSDTRKKVVLVLIAFAIVAIGISMFNFLITEEKISETPTETSNTSIIKARTDTNEPEELPTEDVISIDETNTLTTQEDISQINLIENAESINIGTLKFSEAIYTDGNNDFDISTFYKIQRIRLEENPNGCDISDWFSDFLWVTGNKGAQVSINDEIIGELNINTGNHGYLIIQKINPGDEVCIIGDNRNGFSILFGPDVFYHYDSYCYRGFCN
ncbi:MAG: hypothetical protein U9R53_08840 [Chloroflexota bacterium]|nr:hypothetical protein [Chloroflexota bacterium]